MTPMGAFWRLITVATFILFTTSTSVTQSQSKAKPNDASSKPTVLRVVLYPFVPDFATFRYQLEHDFEVKHPNVDVQVIDLSANYYNPAKPAFVGETNADLIELDSVFLADFVKEAKLQVLPRELIPSKESYLTNAFNAAQWNGQFYGVPHWVCGNFLFFRKDDAALRNVKTLTDLENAIQKANKSGTGLLIDLKGTSTLGELYLDSAFDQYSKWQDAQNTLPQLEGTILENLQRTRRLCETRFCRDDAYHGIPGFYARRLARREGRVLAAYSESLYYFISESENSCTKEDQCLNEKDLAVGELPLASTGSTPISWVDLFVITTQCKDECMRAARSFIHFATSDQELLKSIKPEWPRPTRYLLSAKRSIYANEELLRLAPLYQSFLPIMDRAATPSATGLNRVLRERGKDVDGKLP